MHLSILASGQQWLSRKVNRVMKIRTGQRSSSCPRSMRVSPDDSMDSLEALKQQLCPVVCWQDVPTFDTLPECPDSSRAHTLPDILQDWDDSDSESSLCGELQLNHAPSVRKMVATCVQEVSAVLPWVPGQYQMVGTLQQPSQQGSARVDLMRNMMEGGFVVVKSMPISFSKTGAMEYQRAHPGAREQPWADLAIVRHLNRLGFPHVCEAIGAYQDSQHSYFVTSCATGGDLCSWRLDAPRPGPQREAEMRPIARQVIRAVRWLHDLDICHRDICMENLVLHENPDGSMQVKLTGFGAATLSRRCSQEVRGKPAYQAPELHLAKGYDAFLSDAFAVGVALFTLAANEHPWRSTRPGECSTFGFCSTFGLRKMMQERKLRQCGGSCVAEVLSPQLVELLQGLLALQPRRRLTLGELAWGTSCIRQSVRSMGWMRPQDAL